MTVELYQKQYEPERLHLIVRPIKNAIALFLILLTGTGCFSTGPYPDDFLSLHTLVRKTLTRAYDCGPVLTNEVVGHRYFEVSPHPHGLPVNVSERQFLTRKEWRRRYVSGINLFDQFLILTLTNRQIDAQTAQRMTNLFGLYDLPGWRYKRTGVDVKVQDVDETYPGLDRDLAEAQKCHEAIVGLLKPYRRDQ